MKKFSLLTLVAVMVMAFAGAAFAGEAAITAIGNQAAGADTNIGKVTGTVASKDITAPLYYFNASRAAGLTFALSLDHANASAVTTLTGKGTALDQDGGTADLDLGSAETSASGTGPVAADLTYADVSLDKLPKKIELTELLFKNGSGTGDLVSMDIIPTPVNDMITVGAMPALIEGGLSVDKTAVKMSTSGVAIKGLTTDNVLVSFDKALPSKVAVAISEDGVLSFEAAAGLVSTDVGTYQGYIVVLDGQEDSINVSDDKVGDIKIAGLKSDDVLATFQIVVAEDTNKAAAEAVAAAAASDDVPLNDYQPAKPSEISELTVTEEAALIAALSNDMSGSSNEILASKVVDVVLAKSGDYTVIVSSDVITGIVSNDLRSADKVLDFYKVYNNALKPELVQRHQNGVTTFGYTLVIIDDAAPADAVRAQIPAGITGMGQPGLKISEANRILYVWDGVRDGRAHDPIVAVRSTAARGSSSSSCDMGFGLAALAGLAVLALRKRSK